MWKICRGVFLWSIVYVAYHFQLQKIDQISKYTKLCTCSTFNCSSFCDVWRICDIHSSLWAIFVHPKLTFSRQLLNFSFWQLPAAKYKNNLFFSVFIKQISDLSLIILWDESDKAVLIKLLSTF